MEKIVMSGKEYRNLTNEFKIKDRGVFYNQNMEILVYQNGKEVQLPSVDIKYGGKCLAYQTTGVYFLAKLNEQAEHFLQLLDYSYYFQCENNKLKRIYLEKIRNYYSCMFNVESGWEKILPPIEKLDEILYPKLMELDQILDIYSEEKYTSHTVYALETFKDTERVKKYVR